MEIGSVVLCLLGALLATLPHSPANMSYVYPDGGVFLYVAERLREGALLYRDVWDHKPPLIYYLNALGLYLGNGSRWGVWVLEFAAVSAAGLVGYFLLRRAFGKVLALLVTGLWLLTFFALIDDGNLTETFVLPLQFVALALACAVERNHNGVYRGRAVLLGILLGGIFWLKPNEIGVGLAIGSYILLRGGQRRKWRLAFTNLGMLLGGFGLVTGLVLLPFMLQGALFELWDAVFVFNVIYSRRFPFLQSRLVAVAQGYSELSFTALPVLGLLGFVLGAALLWRAREHISPHVRVLLGIAALALPFEILLVTTSGRPFAHYYVGLLYVLTVFAAWFLWLLREGLVLWLNTNALQARQWVTLGIVVAVGGMSLPALYRNYQLAKELQALEPPPVIQYIRQNTSPQDTVWVWGLETRMLYFAGRRAPTKFPHTIAFEHPLYATPQVVENYFGASIQARPALIVDTRGYGLNNFTVADSEKIRRHIYRLGQQYQPVGDVGGGFVYERKVTP